MATAAQPTERIRTGWPVAAGPSLAGTAVEWYGVFLYGTAAPRIAVVVLRLVQGFALGGGGGGAVLLVAEGGGSGRRAFWSSVAEPRPVAGQSARRRGLALLGAVMRPDVRLDPNRSGDQ